MLADPLFVSPLFEVNNEILSSDSYAHCHAQHVAKLVCKTSGSLFVVDDEDSFVSHHDNTVFLEKHKPISRHSCRTEDFLYESLTRRIFTYSF